MRFRRGGTLALTAEGIDAAAEARWRARPSRTRTKGFRIARRRRIL
jgi:hypothetical protein